MYSDMVFAGLIDDLGENLGDIFYFGKPRSPHWQTFREKFLQQNNFCAACGIKKFLQVHHIKSYCQHPELELEWDNLITLCQAPGRFHHFGIGHLYNYDRCNPHVREDAAFWLKRFQELEVG